MGKSLRADILELLGTTIRANREALIALRGDTAYLWNAVTQLKNDGLVAVNKADMWTIRLTQAGVRALAEENERLCDFYLQYSCGNKPGSTLAHKKAQCKASELVALCMRNGILTGTDKPIRGLSMNRVLGGGEAALYLMKELKFEKGQKIGRAQVSRASAVLLSDGIDALVYNAQADILGLNGSAEKAGKYHASELRRDVCAKGVGAPITRSIVVGYDYVTMKKLMLGDGQEPKEKERKRKTIYDAIKDRTITATDILYVPLNGDGDLLLNLLTQFTQDEILRMFFTADELSEGKKNGGCEAKVRGLYCFEMVTMNLTKLNKILQVYEDDLDSVGLVCLESQVQTIRDIVGNDNVHLRITKNEAVSQRLRKGEI